ncbi:predicted protein [Plenodomus lingam JN3]|uniref:Predicted protein n=1 Tax=Leptosphaeria maculans (strain JN3 / isolate v23.1.3 / race Av1-4-5-6-7-8) TaxID=985895 RepID=E4ZQ23_LEPMJ|nr:predicted protein [Plenodomus lingam JN3]CBX93558.1 predicted protein [Plenodomus lingam JN3]
MLAQPPIFRSCSHRATRPHKPKKGHNCKLTPDLRTRRFDSWSRAHARASRVACALSLSALVARPRPRRRPQVIDVATTSSPISSGCGLRGRRISANHDGKQR